MSLSQKAEKATSVDLDVRRFDEKEADLFFWLVKYDCSIKMEVLFQFAIGSNFFHIINQIDKNKKKSMNGLEERNIHCNWLWQWQMMQDQTKKEDKKATCL